MLAALNWPQAVVASVAIAALGLILSVVAWQLFETGRAGMKVRSDYHDHKTER